MAITATFDIATQTLQTRASGTVTYADLLDHISHARREAPGVRALFDATGATTDLTPEQVQELARAATTLFERGEMGPTAIVAPDGALFELARIYEGSTSELARPIHVFREVSPALEWLASRRPR